MLWNTVFEFFVKYIFGGRIGNTEYLSIVGALRSGSSWTAGNTLMLQGFTFSDISGTNTYNMPLGNYLSLISTIITMVALVLLCCALIKKIYNICAHVIG